MNSKITLVIAFLLLAEFCIASRRNSYSDRRSRGRGRGRRPESPRPSTRQYPFTSTDVENWLSSLFPDLSIGFSDSSSSSSSSTYQWSFDGNTWSFSSSSSSDVDGSNNPQPTIFTTTRRPTATSTTAQRPWREMGSFTGDLKLQCFDKKCTKGAVLIYNREEKRWGTICGDKWTRRESNVVCNYLQFSGGSRKALRIKEKKLSRENRNLPIAYKQMRCEGDEKVLVECLGEVVSPDNECDSKYYAAVVCSGRKSESSETPRCTDTQVLCRSGGRCIEQSYICDGMSDCPWGTDEEECEDSTDSCAANQFSCGASFGGCIPSTYRCDGDPDCTDAKDENNCEDHLAHFQRTANTKLRLESYRYNTGWRNVSPYLCAKKCREESKFRCVSFDYHKLQRECDLTTESKRDVGVLPKKQSRDYDHYEISVPRRCSGIICADLCVPRTQICDLFPNCPNGADEANCTSAADDPNEAWEVRLSDGVTSMDGRIEVRRGSSGEFGLVCDVDWTLREASVACIQLGFRNGAVAIVPGLTFHPTRKRIVLSGVFCTGREQRLSDCRHDPWGEANCPRNHEAGVICAANVNPAEPPSSMPPRPTISTTRRPTTTISTTSPVTPRSERPSTCGVKPSDSSLVKPRIVGGNNADAHEWPWQVAIWIQYQLLCGGTLINECWVLTAAHCFTRQFPLRSYTVRLGDHLSKRTEGTEQDFGIQRLIAHNYNTDTHDNDIALIELQRKNGRCATLNEYVDIACLPTGPAQFPADHKCKIVGWGQTQSESEIPFTSVLKEATAPLISDNVCATQTVYRNLLSDNMMCAGYLRGGIDTCQGDSGGPLLCKDNGRYYVWGIVSWGNGCAEPRSPGIYTKVSNYLEWIRRTTGF